MGVAYLTCLDGRASPHSEFWLLASEFCLPSSVFSRYNSIVRIAIGSDHAGYRLKEAIRLRLLDSGFTVEDVGTDGDAPVDYPDFAAAVAGRIVSGACERGILVCATGIGMAMAANKVHGVRAAEAGDLESARLARAHNDASVLTLGARITAPDLAMAIVRLFLETPYEGGRHQRRVDKIMALEGADADAPR
jgi:ribose 5-phosphate isomerase B